MRVNKQELKAALGWALVAVVLLALSGWIMTADAQTPATLKQRIARVVRANENGLLCRDDSYHYECGTPGISLGPLVASLLPTAGTDAARNNTGGLPVLWESGGAQADDGVLLFDDRSVGTIHAGPGITQVMFSTSGCSGSMADACSADLQESFERAGIQIQQMCTKGTGEARLYQVAGPGGVPALIEWDRSRPGTLKGVSRGQIVIFNHFRIASSPSHPCYGEPTGGNVQ